MLQCFPYSTCYSSIAAVIVLSLSSSLNVSKSLNPDPPLGRFLSASGRRRQTLAAWRAMADANGPATHSGGQFFFSIFENVEYTNSKS